MFQTSEDRSRSLTVALQIWSLKDSAAETHRVGMLETSYKHHFGRLLRWSSYVAQVLIASNVRSIETFKKLD